MSRFGDKIGVAVVGLGVGEQHARAYERDDRCELLKLYDLDNERANKLVGEFRSAKVVGSFDDILCDNNVKIVSIASFDDAHYEQVVALLEAKKHVFVEKPLCRTVEELRIIKNLWKKHAGEVKICSNLILRAAPLYRWLKREIDCGKVGELYSFDAEYLYGRFRKITHGWRKNVNNYSVIEGGGIHLVDLMVWLTGQRPKSVFSVGSRICSKNTEFRYDDYVTSMLSFPSGLIGRITANFGCIHRHQHVLRTFGTKATFMYDDVGARFHISRDASMKAVPIALEPKPDTKGDLIPAFVSAVYENLDISEHTQEMFDVVSICASADASLSQNAEMEVIYV